MRVSILMIAVAIRLANAATTHIPMGTESSVLNGGTKDPTLNEGKEMMHENRDRQGWHCKRVLGVKMCHKNMSKTIPRSGMKDLEIGEPNNNQGKEDIVSSRDSALDEGTEEDTVLDEVTEHPTLDEGIDGSGMDEATMDTNESMIEMEDINVNSRGYCFRQCKGTGNARKCKCHPPGCGKCD